MRIVDPPPPPLGPARRARRPSHRAVVEAMTAIVGVALIAAAFAATQRWLDQHFLPSFFLPRAWYVRIETAVRAGIAFVGFLLAVVARSRLAGVAGRAPRAIGRAALAAALALAAGEVVLERVHLRPTGWLVADEEPRRRPDARLGWGLAPARVGRSIIGGRTIEYRSLRTR